VYFPEGFDQGRGFRQVLIGKSLLQQEEKKQLTGELI
jgi:hypothetical protein